MKRLLITGGSGLIGTALTKRLRAGGWQVVGADLRVAQGQLGYGDVLDQSQLLRLAEGCAGIVHLAAVSRVVWGERDPHLCWQTNVEGTSNVLRAALHGRPRPWVIFASSREVYGQPADLPVREDHPLCPVNVYGRAKAEAERMVQAARDHGVRASIVRFSNVFGSTSDHIDRVVPAFARAAATGRPLTVNGWSHTFDFTPLDDTIDGLIRLIEVLESERALPPIHLVTGRSTTLGDLAELAVALGGVGAPIRCGPKRIYDVGSFVGEPTRARELLGWQATTPIDMVLRGMIERYRCEVFPSENPVNAGADL